MNKKVVLSLMVVAIISVTTVFANTKTEKFKVYGTCGTCETAIEKATLEVPGVKSADWNEKTQMLAVSFDGSKTDVHKIQMAIVKTGHDTEMHKAKDEDYNKLNECCKYNRTETKKEMTGHEGHMH
ncbi:MAG: cation transporter [Draconibacterium sp.]|nr:cation transporter [Draconibacterium sp.]